MKGLPPKTSKSISKIVEGKFDKLALSFLGIIPKIEENKSILFSTKRNSLVYLFFKALNSKKPTKQEKDLLKVILSIANGYIDGLKERTKSRILQEMNSYVLNKENRGVPAKTEDLKEIMQNEMNKAKKHFELIANTESNKTINYASAMKISKMAESHGEKDPTVFFMVTVDDRTGDEEFVLHLLPDKTTPRVWKLSEVKSEYHKKGDSTPSLCGLHPNCFVGNLGVSVLTEKDGYKNISKVKIGDRVLTHTGKFKQVVNTLEWYSKKYYGQFVKIKYKTKVQDSYKITTLKVTPDHEFMTQRGWVKAGDLNKDDKFKHLYTGCSTCGKEIMVRKKRKREKMDGFFCSRSCKTSYQWKCPDHRKKVSQKSREFMKSMWENPTESMLEQIRKMNKITREKVKNKEFWAQKPENLETLQKNIAKTNQKLQKDRMSKEEKELFDKVKEVFPTAKSQFILEKWCVDIFIPELNVNIEYDGGGHYLPVYTGKYTMESFLAKQEGRDIYLEKCGYHILRYSETPCKEKIIEDVLRVSKNSNSEYYFKEIDLVSVEKVKNGKGGYRLYDITVEDDESFVVNGIVSHNCRCKINYLANGWGFDSEGKIKFKGVDWDEFKFQRKEYGLPRQGLKKAEDDTGSPMDHMYQTNRGGWELHDTAPAGLDHPDNITSPLHQHKTSHITESGHRTWTIKNPQTKDDQFKGASKRFFRDNENKYGEDSLKSLAGLVRQTSQHPDRHAVHTGDSRNQAIRSRHLYNMFKGKDGYSMKELNKDGKHKGWILTAERHPGGKTMQTVWYWDGKSLRTHHHGKKKYF